MRVSKFIHSCVLVQKDDSAILFDPGKFSFIEKQVRPQDFHGLNAIILTHGHPDHVDSDALSEIFSANPTAIVYGNQETAAGLRLVGIEVTPFETGTRQMGAFAVEAIAAEHAPIIGPAPPRNTAYLLDKTLLNPGDSFSESLEAYAGTPALLLPVMAPWEKEPEMMAFAERMKPRIVIPVHDGQAKDFFLHLRYAAFKEEFEKRAIDFAELSKPGDSITI